MNWNTNYFVQWDALSLTKVKQLSIWLALTEDAQSKIESQLSSSSDNPSVIRQITNMTGVFLNLDTSLKQFALDQLNNYWNIYCQKQAITYHSESKKEITKSHTTSSCNLAFLQFARDLSHFVKHPSDEIVNMMKGAEYGLDESILATSLIVIFLCHQKLHLPLFIPIVFQQVNDEISANYQSATHEKLTGLDFDITLQKAWGYSQLHFLLTGRHLPIVLLGSLADDKEFNHAISIYILPVTLSYEEQDEDEQRMLNPTKQENELTKWTLLLMDSSGTTSHGIGKDLLKQLLNQIMKSFKIYTKALQLSFRDHREVVSLATCSTSFQNQYNTCGHWSFAFVLNILYNFPRYSSHYTDTDLISSWCKQLFESVSSLDGTTQMLNLLADLGIIFYKFIFYCIVEPILLIPAAERGNISALITQQCSRLANVVQSKAVKQSKSSEEETGLDQAVINQFCLLTVGMVKKWLWVHL